MTAASKASAEASAAWTEQEIADLKPAHGQWEWAPSETSEIDQDSLLELVVVVAGNETALEQALNEVSDPKSAMYGKVFTKENLRELVLIPVANAKVEEWISGIEGSSVKEYRGSTSNHILVEATVKAWNTALNTEFQYFIKQMNVRSEQQHSDSSREVPDSPPKLMRSGHDSSASSGLESLDSPPKLTRSGPDHYSSDSFGLDSPESLPQTPSIFKSEYDNSATETRETREIRETTEKQKLVRCASYSVPSHVAEFIIAIHGTTQFPVPISHVGHTHANVSRVRDAIRINPVLKSLEADSSKNQEKE